MGSEARGIVQGRLHFYMEMDCLVQICRERLSLRAAEGPPKEGGKGFLTAAPPVL